jgi:hypothetical protein
MEHNENLLKQILMKVERIEMNLQDSNLTRPLSEEWIRRDEVMHFFDYGDTQIAAFEKQQTVVTAKVGKRKFFKKQSILDLLERSSKL